MGIVSTGELAQSTSPGTRVVAVVALISTAGALNGWILLQGPFEPV